MYELNCLINCLQPVEKNEAQRFYFHTSQINLSFVSSEQLVLQQKRFQSSYKVSKNAGKGHFLPGGVFE